MTKAERIYRATRYECKDFVLRHGQMINPDGTIVGFNSVSYDDSDFICTRTLNDMERFLRRDRKTAESSKKLGIISEEEANQKEQIFTMIEATIRNTRNMLKELFA